MWSVVFACLGAIASQEHAAVASAPCLRLEKTYPLPKVEGRIDHMALDGWSQRLFVAALGNGTIEILDPEHGSATTSVRTAGEPTGAANLYARSCTVVGDGSLGKLWAWRSFKPGTPPRPIPPAPDFLDGTKCALGEGALPDADNVRSLSESGSVLVGYGGGALAIVETAAFRVKASIELNGHPESFQVNAAENRCWVNVPDKQAIGVVDLEGKKVLRWIEVKAAKRNYPMALAEPEKRLLVGCREPAKLLVYDIDTDALTAELPLSGDVDDLFVDTDRNLVYASCGEGFLDVFERTGPGEWKPKEKIQTSPGARTCLFVPSEKQLFVAVPHRGEQQAEIRVFSTAP